MGRPLRRRPKNFEHKYAEIRSYANLARHYRTSKSTISRWISDLRLKGSVNDQSIVPKQV